jgi:hypothetical protein
MESSTGEAGRHIKLKQIDATPCESGITVHTYLPEVATRRAKLGG